jgi:hypothetical protein
LRNVDTFGAVASNEVNTNGAPALVSGGFTPLSLFLMRAFPQTFFHNGVATSLNQGTQNLTRRSAGRSWADTFTNAADRANIVNCLFWIDAMVAPINRPPENFWWSNRRLGRAEGERLKGA